MNIQKIVLLIDDDEDDREMLQQALHAIDGEHKIVMAHDGKDGLKKLTNLSASDSLPCLIVLDINMPKLDGKQAFVAIKGDPTLSKIPVVIFSTSSSQLDRMFFEKYNTAYFVKPIKVCELAEAASRMIGCCSHKFGSQSKESKTDRG
jgi:CheY-like chemotaxis protein